MRVHPIQTGIALIRRSQRAGRSPARTLRPLLDPHWTAPQPIRAWLVEHPEGPILVDTGETARVHEAGYLPRWHPFFRRALREEVRPEQELGPALRRLGVDADDLRLVVLTHLHCDHTGGLHHLRGAPDIVVSARELALARGPLGRALGYLPHRWPDWFAPRAVTPPRRPHGPFPGSLPLTEAGDVVLLPTPGHTPGHASVLLEPPTGPRILLAGDATYAQSVLLADRIDGIAPSARTARRTLERIRGLAAERPTVILPTHDPDAVRRLDLLEPFSD
jgi:glyoxylase-like metal-dependent hydrolase (beta-lactamase superfamily II)